LIEQHYIRGEICLRFFCHEYYVISNNLPGKLQTYIPHTNKYIKYHPHQKSLYTVIVLFFAQVEGRKVYSMFNVTIEVVTINYNTQVFVDFIVIHKFYVITQNNIIIYMDIYIYTYCNIFTNMSQSVI